MGRSEIQIGKIGSTERKRQRTSYQPVGTWIRRDKRLSIYLRDGFFCLACNLDVRDVPQCRVTLDHVVPLKRGGRNEAMNLYTCCISCNSKRGAQSLRQAFDQDV